LQELSQREGFAARGELSVDYRSFFLGAETAKTTVPIIRQFGIIRKGKYRGSEGWPMNWLKKITNALSAGFSKGEEGDFYTFQVKCNRCGETLTGRVNLMNELSAEYGTAEESEGYTCRKVLMGGGRCFQQVEVILYFNSSKSLTNREIHGGKFLDETETTS
jgi:hypothetical protein